MLWKIITLLICLIVNASLGARNGEVSELLSNQASCDFWLTPANFTFGIWGVIYILLMIWAIRDSFISNNIYIADDLIKSLMVHQNDREWAEVQAFNVAWLVMFTAIGIHGTSNFIIDKIFCGICVIILGLLCDALRRLWIMTPNWYERNVCSLYGGWCVVAFFLNMGLFVRQFTCATWVEPLMVLGITITHIMIQHVALNTNSSTETFGALIALGWASYGIYKANYKD